MRGLKKMFFFSCGQGQNKNVETECLLPRDVNRQQEKEHNCLTTYFASSNSAQSNAGRGSQGRAWGVSTGKEHQSASNEFRFFGKMNCIQEVLKELADVMSTTMGD